MRQRNPTFLAALPLALSIAKEPEEGGSVLALLPETLAVIRSQALPSFWLSLIGGLVLAAGGWLGAAYFVRLWNRRYRLRLWQHALCALMALVAFATVPLWTAATYVEGTTRAVGALWEEHLAVDETWQQQTYAEAYEAVRGLGTEDLADAPSPGQAGSRIPLTDSASVRAVADVYARRTATRFREDYPHLSAFVREARAGNAASLGAWEHLRETGALRPLTQPARQAAAATVAHVLDPVLLWTWRVRLTTGSLFFVVHLLTFGVVGYLATRDIHTHT